MIGSKVRYDKMVKAGFSAESAEKICDKLNCMELSLNVPYNATTDDGCGDFMDALVDIFIEMKEEFKTDG